MSMRTPGAWGRSLISSLPWTRAAISFLRRTLVAWTERDLRFGLNSSPLARRVNKAAAIVLLATATVVGGCIVHHYASRWTPEEVEQALQRDLPAGSTKEQVTAFLQANHFHYEFFNRDSDLAKSTRPPEIKPANYGGVVLASMSASDQANLGLLTGGYIGITFYLDKDRRLIKYQIQVQRLYLLRPKPRYALSAQVSLPSQFASVSPTWPWLSCFTARPHREW
jgi:hypothetical protein